MLKGKSVGHFSYPSSDGQVWYTALFENGKSGAEIYKQDPAPVKLQFGVGNYSTVFQLEIFAIAVCAKEIIFIGKTNEHVFISLDNPTPLKALNSSKITSLLFLDC